MVTIVVSISDCGTVRAREHDGIAFGIPQPAFPMGVLTAVAGFYYVRLEFLRSRDRCVKIFQLKPKQHAIPIGPKVRISEWTVMMLDIPLMQLEDQNTIPFKTFVVGPPMAALAAEQPLIPATARLDVVHTNEWLEMHNKKQWDQSNPRNSKLYD